MGLGKVTDIQYGGKRVMKVIYQGETIWEREPDVLPAKVMQTVTSTNCPTTRTLAVDARDNATYWIQKLADGKCWMLTNLAYGGGGNNTYNDVKTIINNNILDYIQPYYMIPTGANRTLEPTNPSISTDGGVTSPQYGYLYNWCAAMGAQTGTSACMSAAAPLPDQNTSICPNGWRLPTARTAGAGGEYQQLTDSVGATTNGIGNGVESSIVLRSAWLGMDNGLWNNGFVDQGSVGYYWSSIQSSATTTFQPFFNSSHVNSTNSMNKTYGISVRCIAV